MTRETKIKKSFNYTEFPSDWVIKRFEQVCNKLLDGTHFSPQSKEGYFKYITSKNIRNEGLELGNLDFISTEEHKSIYKRCPVKFGDILLTKDGAGTGTCCINTLQEEFSLLSSVAVLNANPDFTINEYLLQYIQSPLGQKIIQEEISGQAITRITLEKIKKFKISLPPLVEQKAIAKVLSTADAAIHINEKLIVQKELRKKWLMQQLLTGKKRLKGFTGSWETLKIKNIGIVPEKKPISKVEQQKLLTVKLHTKGIEFNEREKPIISSSGRPYYERKEGEILIGRQNIHNGGIGIVTKEFDGHICSNAISSFKVNDKNSTAYILFHLQYPSNYLKIEDYMGGTGQKELSEKQFLEIPIKLPKTKKEQTAIAHVLQAADKEISLLKAKAEKLKEQKKGFMQVLLTGKVRLKM